MGQKLLQFLLRRRMAWSLVQLALSFFNENLHELC